MRKSNLNSSIQPAIIGKKQVEYVDLVSRMKVIVNYCEDDVSSKCAEKRIKSLIKTAYSTKIFD
jgi:hypothetical protein